MSTRAGNSLSCFGLNCTERNSTVILMQQSEVISGNIPIRVCDNHLNEIQTHVRFMLKVISATIRLTERNPSMIMSADEMARMEDCDKKFIFTLFSIINLEIGNLFQTMKPEKVFSNNFSPLHRFQAILISNMNSLSDSFFDIHWPISSRYI